MNIGVLQFPGSNCDQDAFHLFSNGLALHTRYIWHKDTSLGDVDLVVVPGGSFHSAATGPDFCAEATLKFIERHPVRSRA